MRRFPEKILFKKSARAMERLLSAGYRIERRRWSHHEQVCVYIEERERTGRCDVAGQLAACAKWSAHFGDASQSGAIKL